MIWYVSYTITPISIKVLESAQREATPPVPQTIWQACAFIHSRVGKPSTFSCHSPAGPTWVFWVGWGLLLFSGPSAAAFFPPLLCREQAGLMAVRCVVPLPPLVFWGHLSPISVVIIACGFSVLLSRCPHVYVGGFRKIQK